uniref:Uncharacterized protein n=1 Tax=Noctiluca scintillans TaxID=2966 RepID=A0A7S1FGM0_NOCSC|mmetsp:Transcript_59377/g.158037  ORF Transcript_59377/g.158037 Transcript_59377/m.158037 type:complete len:410 (+) Transcript_59377:68-1297(+)
MKGWAILTSIRLVTVFGDALYRQVNSGTGAAECQFDRPSHEFGHSLFQSIAPFAIGTTLTLELDAADFREDVVSSPRDGGDPDGALLKHGLEDSHVLSFLERVHHQLGIIGRLCVRRDLMPLLVVSGVVFTVCTWIFVLRILDSPNHPPLSWPKRGSLTSAPQDVSSSEEPSLGMHHLSHREVARAQLFQGSPVREGTIERRKQAGPMSDIRPRESVLSETRTVSALSASSVSSNLCPELVVPPNCECIVAVPLCPVPPHGLKITDLAGTFILRVVTHAAGSGGTTQGFVVQSEPGIVLARCHASPGDEPEFYVYRGNGDYFATFVLDDAQHGFRLQTVGGESLLFWGDVDTLSVNVTEATGQLIALSEMFTPEFEHVGEFYSLRVSPRTDVGLLLCCLFCVSHLRKRS